MSTIILSTLQWTSYRKTDTCINSNFYPKDQYMYNSVPLVGGKFIFKGNYNVKCTVYRYQPDVKKTGKNRNILISYGDSILIRKYLDV